MSWLGYMYDAVQEQRELWMLPQTTRHGRYIPAWPLLPRVNMYKEAQA